MVFFPRTRLAKHIFQNFSKDRYLSLNQEGLLASNSKDLFFDYDLSNKNCLVTGGDSGIGFQIAETLAKKGANVHIVCKDSNNGKNALDMIQQNSNNNKLFLHVVDLSSTEQVSRFTNQFIEENKEKGLNILINNAGGVDYPLRSAYDEYLQNNRLKMKLMTDELEDSESRQLTKDIEQVEKSEEEKQFEESLDQFKKSNNAQREALIDNERSNKKDQVVTGEDQVKYENNIGYMERARAFNMFMKKEKFTPKFNEQGYEHTFALNTLSSYLLSSRLIPLLEKGSNTIQDKSRVVLTSDGLIYTMRAGLHSLLKKRDDYHPESALDPVDQYIVSKRAILSLNHAFAAYTENNDVPVIFNAYHPGFVDTPLFYKISAPWSKIGLRDVSQGADTALYLAMSPEITQNERYEKGGLFFEDRADVPEEFAFSAPAHGKDTSLLFTQNIERSLNNMDLSSELGSLSPSLFDISKSSSSTTTSSTMEMDSQSEAAQSKLSFSKQ